jgi:hypothetical protein
MKYTIEDTFDVSAQRYWDEFFNPEYANALWPALDIKYELIKLERKGEGDALEIHREQKLSPNRELPALIQKFVKGGLSYVEKNHYKAKDSAMRTTTIPSFMADKITTGGLYRVIELGPTKCKRVWEGEVDCSIALIGGKVEKMLVDEVRESYRKATEFTRKWHAERPA